MTLHIINDHARGLTEVTINGVVYNCADQIDWMRWHVTPNTKVWSKKSFIWAPTEAWKKYCAFKDTVARFRVTLEPGDHVVFHMPMPKSWSIKKREEHAGQVHTQKPDLDNLLAGLFDAVHPNQARHGKAGTGDQHIHTMGSLRKVWAWEGGIEIGRKVT